MFLSGEAGFLVISGIVFFASSLFFGATAVIFSVIAIFLYGIEEGVFARLRGGFPLAMAVINLSQGVMFWLFSWFVTLL